MTEDSPLIDQQEAANLVRQLPDPGARQNLIRLCLPLADRLALRFRHSGEAIDDLQQAARFGLIKAVDNADPARAESFLGYATTMIRGELRHHLRDTALVKRPRSIHDNEWAVRSSIDILTQRLGRAPTLAEISDHAELERDVVVDVYSAMVGGPVAVRDFEATVEVGDPDRNHDLSLLVEWESVAPVLAGLPTQERQVLYLRFYRELTQSQMAAELGVSQVQVSRLIRRALDRVRSSVS